ncbi:hypothetical protein B1A_11703, partial [mine drainage metagenome]
MKGRLPAGALHLSDHLQSQRRLARGLRPEDLHDPPARQPADPERHIKSERAGGNRRDGKERRIVPEPHHAT